MANMKNIPCIVRDMDDKTLQLYSIAENLHREDLSPVEEEKAVYKLWETHYEPAGKSQKQMSKDLGKGQEFVRQRISAYQLRKGLGAERARLTTHDILRVSGLDDESARRLLEAKTDGTISQRDMDAIAPEIRKVSPNEQMALVEKIVKEHEEAENFKKAVQEEAKALASGELESDGVKVVKSADLKRMDRFRDLFEKVRFWSVMSVEMIEPIPLRKKTIAMIEQTRDHCEKLLQKLYERDWYVK